jgi:hypothetical protein
MANHKADQFDVNSCQIEQFDMGMITKSHHPRLARNPAP